MKINLLILGLAISLQIFSQEQKTNIFLENNDDCLCQESINKVKPQFVLLLKQRINFNLFSKIITWKLNDGQNTFDELFYKNCAFNCNTKGSQERITLKLITKNPLIFYHPEDSIGINLTPCKANFYDFDINAIINYPISNYIRNYDFKKDFDNSTQSYIKILCSLYLDKNILQKIFEEKNENEIKNIISKINKKYKINVVYDEDENYIDYILNSLKNKQISFEKFLGDIIIKTSKNNNHINKIEIQRLNYIFNSFLNKDIIVAVNDLITPNITLSSNTKYIGFIIESKMLSNPDQHKNNKLAKTEIIAEINNFEFSTEKGLNFKIKNICLPLSEIAKTGIEISCNSKDAKFINSSRLIIPNGVNIYIPQKRLNAEIKNLNVNNKFISGEIYCYNNNLNKINHYFKRKGFKIKSYTNMFYFEKTIK